MTRVSARGVIIKDGQVLLMERWRDDLHYFSVPGGGVEAGETIEQAVVRELAEETSCTVRPVRELYFLRLPNGDESHVLLCEYVAGEPHLPADAPEAQEPATNRFLPRWLPLAELADTPFLVWEPVKRQLLADLSRGFRESVQELAYEP